MKKLLRRLLLKPILRLSAKYSSAPVEKRVFEALSGLLEKLRAGDSKKGKTIEFPAMEGKFIVFSDQHKGARNGSDDFTVCEPAYLAALDHYNREGFHLVALGDSEELWENGWMAVKREQGPSFEKEKAFHDRAAFTKIFGNHDLTWDNDPLAPVYLRSVYGTDVSVCEGVLLRAQTAAGPLELYCTHGHQGDEVSDGNWFSKFFVARIWAPLQSWLAINPNTPAYDSELKTKHNALMYAWSARQKHLLLITGHTHQPVFESMTHMERLLCRRQRAMEKNDAKALQETEAEIRKRQFEYPTIAENYESLQPAYFNSGCCCFSDGEITGIEISNGQLRLVKWRREGTEVLREVLEEAGLEELRIKTAEESHSSRSEPGANPKSETTKQS
jgi:hypothetical protein